jgi:hypothetical protein
MVIFRSKCDRACLCIIWIHCVPVLVIMVLNLRVFILPVGSGERVSYVTTTLLALTVFLRSHVFILPYKIHFRRMVIFRSKCDRACLCIIWIHCDIRWKFDMGSKPIQQNVSDRVSERKCMDTATSKQAPYTMLMIQVRSYVFILTYKIHFRRMVIFRSKCDRACLCIIWIHCDINLTRSTK